MKNRIILSIDPGYDRLGFAVGEISNKKLGVLDFGCIQTKKEDELFDRYLNLIEELEKLITKFKPSELAIEELYFSKNTKTALRVSESKGLVLTLALQDKLKIFEYHPNKIKLTVTGHGKADKRAVDKMTRLQLTLSNKKIIDDAMDALAILLTHSILVK